MTAECAPPQAQPTDMGPHAISGTATCLHCDQAVHETGHDTWVHTGTGSFVCRNANGVPMGHWAEPTTVDSREAAEQKAFEEGVADCAEGHDAMEEGAFEDGASEAWADLSEKVQAVLDEYERLWLGDADLPNVANTVLTELLDRVRTVLNART